MHLTLGHPLPPSSPLHTSRKKTLRTTREPFLTQPPPSQLSAIYEKSFVAEKGLSSH